VDGIEVFPRQDEIGSSEYGNAIRGPLGIHRANMHRYWFEDAPSNLPDQIAYLRSVKRLTGAELETFTEGVSIPESVCGRVAKDVAPSDVLQAPFRCGGRWQKPYTYPEAKIARVRMQITLLCFRIQRNSEWATSVRTLGPVLAA
jgi:hypothetical protein